jgi:hypothetical protein
MLVDIPYQVQVATPRCGLFAIHKSNEIADIEILEFGKLKDLAIGARRSSEDMVCATKVSGNNSTAAKSSMTVFPFWSTPKLLGCMSDWVNMRRSPLIPTGDNCCWAPVGSSVNAWPILHVSEWCARENKITNAPCAYTVLKPRRLRKVEVPCDP